MVIAAEAESMFIQTVADGEKSAVERNPGLVFVEIVVKDA
jgi:hypothetical protein